MGLGEEVEVPSFICVEDQGDCKEFAMLHATFVRDERIDGAEVQ